MSAAARRGVVAAGGAAAGAAAGALAGAAEGGGGVRAMLLLPRLAAPLALPTAAISQDLPRSPDSLLVVVRGAVWRSRESETLRGRL